MVLCFMVNGFLVVLLSSFWELVWDVEVVSDGVRKYLVFDLLGYFGGLV